MVRPHPTLILPLRLSWEARFQRSVPLSAIRMPARPNLFTRILGGFVGGLGLLLPSRLLQPPALLRLGGLILTKMCPCLHPPAVVCSRLRFLLGGFVLGLPLADIMVAALPRHPLAVVGGSLLLFLCWVVPRAPLLRCTMVWVTFPRWKTFPSRLLGLQFVGGLRPCGFHLPTFPLSPSRSRWTVSLCPPSSQQMITFRHVMSSCSGFAPRVFLQLVRMRSFGRTLGTLWPASFGRVSFGRPLRMGQLVSSSRIREGHFMAKVSRCSRSSRTTFVPRRSLIRLPPSSLCSTTHRATGTVFTSFGLGSRATWGHFLVRQWPFLPSSK